MLAEKTLFPSLILAPRMSGIDIRKEMITNRQKFDVLPENWTAEI